MAKKTPKVMLAVNQEPTANGQQPRANSQEPRANSQQPRANSMPRHVRRSAAKGDNGAPARANGHLRLAYKGCKP